MQRFQGHGGHFKNNSNQTWYTRKNITGVDQMKGHILTKRLHVHLNKFDMYLNKFDQLPTSKAGTFDAMRLDAINMAPPIKQRLHFLSAGTTM